MTTKVKYLLCSLLFFSLWIPVEGQIIFETEFEEYETGAETLTDWIGTSSGAGSYGIDSELISGLGKTASIGFARPNSTLVTLVKGHQLDPVALGKPEVTLETFLGVEDSTNGRRDTFSIVFLNAAGQLIASLEFRNDDAVFGIWYSDGVTVRESGFDFIRSELQLLTVQIDFATNRWSAQLDGIDIINDVTFHAGTENIDLGFTGVQWDLTSETNLGFGNNFLLIADWVLAFEPSERPKITQLHRSGSVDVISFSKEEGFTYSLQTTDDLSAEFKDNAEAVITPEGFTLPVQTSKRFFRVTHSLAR